MTADSRETSIAWDPLPRWGSASPIETRESKSLVPKDPLSPPPPVAPFVVDQTLNAKLSLWRGSLWRLQVDVVVNSTCEKLQENDGVSGKLLKAAGPEIRVECDAVGVCRTGEAVLTRGCQLPAKFILHTVGPRYLPKYHNAAEHALHSCYRSVLSVAKENGLRTVGIGCIYTQRKMYPREEAAHVAVRTVRRFMEHYADDFDRIVLCMDSMQDEFMYERVLPLYFPRTTREELASQRELATRDIGDSFGEPIIAERKIRIGDLGSGYSGNQQQQEHCWCNDKVTETQPTKRLQHSSDSTLYAEDDEAENDIKAFRAMVIDPDAERLSRLQLMQEERLRLAAEAAAEEQKRQEKAIASSADWDYIYALKRAKQQDFSDLKAQGFCYCGGVDLAGMPVIVYLAGNLRIEDVDLERVLLFVLDTLDTLRASLSSTSPQFNVLYVQSDVTDENQPPTSWIKRLFRVFSAVASHRAPSDRPLHNLGSESVLRFFYVLEPSLGLKFQLLMSKSYCDGGGFYNHVVYLQQAEMLDSIAPALKLS